MRIAFFADLHLKGKNFKDCQIALRLLSESLKEKNPDIIIDGGDLFETPRIADKYRSLGDLQRLALDFFNYFNDKTVYICEGNHTISGSKKSCLEFLEADNRLVVRSPIVIGDAIKIGLMPWIAKSVFYSKECVGLSQKESEQKYTKALYDMLGIFKNEFSCAKASLLFGHADIQGTKINAGYTTQSGSFTFTFGALQATNAGYISLGHIHKRGNAYAGALFQHSFGEEGNPSGYEIIDIDDETGTISVEYIELIDAPSFVSIEVNSIVDVPQILASNVHYRLLFNSEDAYVKAQLTMNLDDFVIEKRWKDDVRYLRTDTELSTNMSDRELLDVYMGKNQIPEGLTLSDLEEAETEAMK